MNLFLFKHLIWTLLVFLVATDITLTIQATRPFERSLENDSVKQDMTRLLSLPGYEMSDTLQRGSLQSYGKELQTLKYVPKSPFFRRRKRNATERPNRIRKTKHKCSKTHFRECLCEMNYRLCKQNKKGTTLTSIYESKWTEYNVSYRGMNCKLLCEQCTCSKVRIRSSKTIGPPITTTDASKITTSTMATNTLKYTTINDSVIHHDKELSVSSVLLTAATLSLGAFILLIFIAIRVFLKRIQGKNSPNIRQCRRALGGVPIKECSTIRRRQTNMKPRLKRYRLDNLSCSIKVEQELDSLLLNLNDKEDNVNKQCKSAELPADTPPVKECTVTDENVEKMKLSIVRPLTGPVQVYLSSSRLNWDEIFRYLAKNLTTSDYKLFFNILYGSCHHLQVGGDRDTGSYIEKVETRVRRDGGDSETLMFELFNQWKQIMGSNVSTEYIEEALRERSNNLVLEKFKEFMRTPPLLPRVPERSKFQPTFDKITKPNCGDETLQYFPYNEIRNTRYMLPNAPQCTVLPLANEEVRNAIDLDTREFSNTAYPTTEEINNTTNGPVIEEIGEQDMDLSFLTSSSGSSGSLSDRCSVLSSGEIILKRKRMNVKRHIMIYGNEEIPNKVRKRNASIVPLENTRRQRKQHTALDLHSMTQSMISLIKQVLPLSPKPLDTYQYNVFLEHTISSVTKQTGESRNTVLSLSLSAYCETETFKTKRNDTFYFIYVKDRCLILGHEEFENLRLYTDFARRNLVREITKQNGEKFKEPEALFLSYDGKPFLKKKKVVRALKKTAQEAKSLSEGSLDEFPTSSSTLIPEKYDSTVRENEKEHVTPTNQKMDPVTCLEDTVGLPNTKMDCSLFEVVSKGSENPAPRQHFSDVKDIMDNGSIDINYEHKIPYLGDDSEKETSKDFSLKENNEAVEIEDLKVQATDCTLATVVSGATNVTLQNQIVSDTNICDMVRENAQGKRESEIMFACLSCLIQNEIHNDPKSPGTFLRIELD